MFPKMNYYQLGADAVLGVRYQNSTVVAGATEIMVYGTAVKLYDDVFVHVLNHTNTIKK